MPVTSKVLTPIRLFAIPSRMPRFGEVVPLEEVAQRDRERLWVAKLSADDDAVVERLPHGLHELGRAAVVDARRCDLRAADLEADDLLRAAARTRRLGERRLRGAAGGATSTSPSASASRRPARQRPIPWRALEREVALVERDLAAGLGRRSRGCGLGVDALGLRRASWACVPPSASAPSWAWAPSSAWARSNRA